MKQGAMRLLDVFLAFMAVAIAILSLAWGWKVVGNWLALGAGLIVIGLFVPWRLAEAQRWKTSKRWAFQVFAATLTALMVNTCWVFRVPHCDVSLMSKAVSVNGQVLAGDYYFFLPTSWPLPAVRTLDEQTVIEVAISQGDKENHLADGKVSVRCTVRVHMALLPYTATRNRLFAEKRPSSATTKLTVQTTGNAVYAYAQSHDAGNFFTEDMAKAVKDALREPIRQRGYSVEKVEAPDLVLLPGRK